MDAYKQTNKLFELIAVGLAVALTKTIADWLSTTPLVQNNPWLTWVVSIGLVVLLNETITFMFQTFYEQFKPLRQLLLGNQFVEGTWIEFVSQGQKIISIGISNISSSGYELKISGNNHALNGNLRYGFSSTADMVKVEWPVFRYVYEEWPLEGHQDTIQGVAHIKFGPTNNRPTIYTGAFSDIGTGVLTGIEGRLITSKDELKSISNPAEIRKVLKKYLIQRKQEIADSEEFEAEVEKLLEE